MKKSFKCFIKKVDETRIEKLTSKKLNFVKVKEVISSVLDVTLVGCTLRYKKDILDN